jgi:hypothetical protein
MRPSRLVKIGLTISALVGLGTVSALAEDARPSARRQCFRADMVTNFREGDGTYVNLRVGVKDVYRLDFMGKCPDIGARSDLALKTRAGSNLICSPMDVDVLTPTSIGPQTCSVKKIHKLTSEEVALLQPRTKP